MGIVFVLLPLSLILALIGVAGYFWSVRNNQFDDTETPALRVILDEHSQKNQRKEKRSHK